MTEDQSHAIMMTKTFDILEKGRAIKCLVCSMISYNEHDIRERYCGRCHKFHQEDKAEKSFTEEVISLIENPQHIIVDFDLIKAWAILCSIQQNDQEMAQINRDIALRIQQNLIAFRPAIAEIMKMRFENNSKEKS